MSKNKILKCYIAYQSGCGAVGSALRSGRRGRWFESSHPDHAINLFVLPQRIIFICCGRGIAVQNKSGTFIN
jgi:hypothetical protein